MNPIRVVVAIVSYKCAALTIECVKSIEAERRVTPGVLISAVVVDNASGDAPALEQAIEENGWSAWVTLVRAPKNGGFPYGTNLAYRSAHQNGPAHYFYLLNPDSLVRRGAIRALVSFLEAHQAAGIAGSSFENLDGSDWPIAFRFPSILSELEGGLQLGLATLLLRRWVVAVEMGSHPQPIDWVCGASMMIRRSVFDTLKGLNENYFLYYDEPDFCLRAKKAGFSTWYVPESRVMHIGGQSTKITERNADTKRLPSYWYESRSRYFISNYGAPYALATDVIAFVANAIGSLKRIVQGRTDRGVPYFLTDLARHSAWWPSNRRFPVRTRDIPGCEERRPHSSTQSDTVSA
jgi:hypothetical protein